ncbi:MAG TPA: RDD family protein [Candidatus Acidoferrales bacterium]|nr:RDD family protein [Candidatus Acidoferrales bacterium]
MQTVLPFETDAPQYLKPAMESSDEPARLILPEPERSALQKIYRENIPLEKPARKDRPPRKILSERFELELPRLDLSTASQGPTSVAPSASASGPAHTDLYPVASLPERRLAALVDIGLLMFTYGGMLALFTVLGGRVGLNKLDVTVTLATLALFYAQYFALFTVFGGSTPGMMVQGLRVIGFSGETPTSRQMTMRSLGYLISAGGCFLGFIWVLWDEDHLCWQDRISHTYLTPNDGNTGH